MQLSSKLCENEYLLATTVVQLLRECAFGTQPKRLLSVSFPEKSAAVENAWVAKSDLEIHHYLLHHKITSQSRVNYTTVLITSNLVIGYK